MRSIWWTWLRFSFLGVIVILSGCEYFISKDAIDLGDPVFLVPDNNVVVNEKGELYAVVHSDEYGYIVEDQFAVNFYSYGRNIYIMEAISIFQSKNNRQYFYGIVNFESNALSLLDVDSTDISDSVKIKHDGLIISTEHATKKHIMKYVKHALTRDYKYKLVANIYDNNSADERRKAHELINSRRDREAEKEVAAALAKADIEKKEREKLEADKMAAAERIKREKLDAEQRGRNQNNWIFRDNHLVAQAVDTSGYSIGAGMFIGCRGNRLALTVAWGAPVKNIYPESSNPEAAKVTVKFGSSRPWVTGWTPVSNRTATVPPDLQTSVGSTVDSLIFDLLGMESTSKKNTEMFNWTAFDFVDKVSKYASSSSSEAALELSTIGANNDPIRLIFDLRGFNEMAIRHLKGRCV